MEPTIKANGRTKGPHANTAYDARNGVIRSVNLIRPTRQHTGYFRRGRWATTWWDLRNRPSRTQLNESGALEIGQIILASLIIGVGMICFVLGGIAAGERIQGPNLLLLGGILTFVLPLLYMNKRNKLLKVSLVNKPTPTPAPPVTPLTKAPTPLTKDDKAVSPVIAVILMVAITVVLAATVFVLVSDLGKNTAPVAPQISWTANHSTNEITVAMAPRNVMWDEFDVAGCTTIPTGNVTAGDTISDCSGEVLIRHLPSNSVSYRDSFS